MRPLHLLIVDDDMHKRFLLNRSVVLQFPGALVFQCASGREALEYCRRHAVDAMITDHSMQPLDGIELVATLRRGGWTFPVIMISARTEIQARAEAAGVDLFIMDMNWLHVGKPIASFLRARGVTDRAGG